MSSGRINSPESIATADRLIAAFGDWAAVEAAAELGTDGVYRVRLPDDRHPHAPRDAERR